jgi:hypothetical protein
MNYPHHTPEELAALSPSALATYQAQRRAFDAEVADLVATARRQGWIDVGTAGKVSRLTIPVSLSHPAPFYRDTADIGLRGQP